jgi:hypothetical protein
MTPSQQKAADDLRASRVHTLTNSYQPHQLAKLGPLQRSLELALARVAPNLAPIIVERLLENLILHPETLIHMSGSSMAELPTTDSAWKAFAMDQVRGEPLAVLCLASRDANKLAVLAQTYISSLKPADRMSQARAGLLDKNAAAFVASEIEKGAGL